MAKILVIDDYAPLLELLQRLLSLAGHEVRTETDGMAGLRLAGLMPFDLVLIDVDLPGMDGISVCKDLKGDPRTRHVRVLLMTGHPRWQVEIRARLAGALRVLAKPFWAGSLLDEIDAATGVGNNLY